VRTTWLWPMYTSPDMHSAAISDSFSTVKTRTTTAACCTPTQLIAVMRTIREMAVILETADPSLSVWPKPRKTATR
jgi:hypothetical protein